MFYRYGTYGVDQPLNAGLDLEMPGPPCWRSSLLVSHCISAQKLSARTIDTHVETMLRFIQKVVRNNPQIVYGDSMECMCDSPEGRAYCRKLAADGIVLLCDEGELLPLKRETVKKIVVIGQHAKAHIISGGRSAALELSYVITPLEGILTNVPSGWKSATLSVAKVCMNFNPPTCLAHVLCSSRSSQTTPNAQ